MVSCRKQFALFFISDMDECLSMPDACANGTCANTYGSYVCNCFAGFQLSANNNCVGKLCMLLDKCDVINQNESELANTNFKI